MSQAQKRRIGFLLAPIVTMTACMIAFMYYSGAEAAPPNAGPSMGDEAPTLGVRRISTPPPVAPPPEFFPRLMIGPVPGLTTNWYEAPTNVPVPLGTTLEFKLTGLLAATQVAWSGATEVERGATFSRAEFVPGAVGIHTVQASVNSGLEIGLIVSSQLNVISAPNLACTVAVSVPPLLLDENSTNAETMDYFFSSDSIAQLTTVGANHYRTSVDRRLTFTAQTQPTGFESMVEWRSGGAVLGLGQTLVDQIITSPGSTVIEVGPVAAPVQVQIDTYSVTITSHVIHVDSITEGVPTTFTAVTDPPGYEAGITWLSSTKYGSGSPVLGSGPSFTAQFDDTWGPWPEDPTIPFQWLGVRADNAAFGQDGVCPPTTGACVSLNGSCVITARPDCEAAGDVYLGDGSNCDPILCVADPADEVVLGTEVGDACDDVTVEMGLITDVDDTRTLTFDAGVVQVGGVTINLAAGNPWAHREVFRFDFSLPPPLMAASLVNTMTAADGTVIEATLDDFPIPSDCPADCGREQIRLGEAFSDVREFLPCIEVCCVTLPSGGSVVFSSNPIDAGLTLSVGTLFQVQHSFGVDQAPFDGNCPEPCFCGTCQGASCEIVIDEDSHPGAYWDLTNCKIFDANDAELGAKAGNDVRRRIDFRISDQSRISTQIDANKSCYDPNPCPTGVSDCACPPPDDPPEFICPIAGSSPRSPDGAALLPLQRCMSGQPGEQVTFQIVFNYDDCFLMCPTPNPLIVGPIDYFVDSICLDWVGVCAVCPIAAVCGPCPPPGPGRCQAITVLNVVIQIPPTAQPGDEEAHCVTAVLPAALAPCNVAQTVIYTEVESSP